MNTVFHLGILGAMREEIGATEENLYNKETVVYGDLTVISGEYKSTKNEKKRIFISLAWSGWGKVSAARAATRLIGIKYQNSSIDIICFTGVAGSVSVKLNQWDIIIPDKVVQHDLDARPIFKQFYIPSFNKAILNPTKNWYEWIFKSIDNKIGLKELNEFKKLNKGLIATGDKFISNKNDIFTLKKLLPEIKAVEMEGAAVAQVAEQEKIPWAIIRTISDSADDSAPEDFSKFLIKYSKSSWLLILCLLNNYLECPKFIDSGKE